MSGPAGFGGIQGLHAFRPFHAGAYTDPGPPALDETSKALQTIAKVMAAKEDPAAQDRGKLSSIGRTEERMLYLARGCDTLTVHLGEATVGKELYHALKSVATQNRPLLREISFPVNITNRIAFGAASLSFGGKGNPPDYCLTVALGGFCGRCCCCIRGKLQDILRESMFLVLKTGPLLLYCTLFESR